MQPAAGFGRRESLPDAVVGSVTGESDADRPRDVGEIGERALGLRDHVGTALEAPGIDEAAEAPAGRRLLDLEVAVELVQGLDGDPGQGDLVRLQGRLRPRDRFAQGLGFGARAERGHRSHLRLLLRAGEGIPRAVEDAIEGIVVARGDGVVLVVVATRAAEREAEDRLAERVDRVLDGEVVVILGVESEATRHGDEPGGRHEPGVRRPGVFPGHDVAGHLLADELVVRHVLR